MADVICNTSPLQYLHQVKHLHLLPALADSVIVPPAVLTELEEGRRLGVELPSPRDLLWAVVREPVSAPAAPLVAHLGPGETQVLMLALETPGTIVVLDDALARRFAETRSIPLIGTLGLLLSAKRLGMIAAIEPLLDDLQALRFRLSLSTRTSVLMLAGEGD